jgi:hypothetical protein
MMIDSDRAFWLAVYRGLMTIADAIKKYKLTRAKDKKSAELTDFNK